MFFILIYICCPKQGKFDQNKMIKKMKSLFILDKIREKTLTNAYGMSKKLVYQQRLVKQMYLH